MICPADEHLLWTDQQYCSFISDEKQKTYLSTKATLLLMLGKTVRQWPILVAKLLPVIYGQNISRLHHIKYKSSVISVFIIKEWLNN